MQIGCSAPTSGPLIGPDSLVRIAQEAEMLGFDYVTVSDHVMIPTSIASRYPYSDSGEFPSGAAADRLEQLTAATFIAASTSKLRIVTSVMVVPHRPAVLTAKILATIDYLSKGRLTLGIGAGWCEEEFIAIGAPAVRRTRRGDRRIHDGLQGTLDQRRAEIRWQICEIQGRAVSAEAGAEVDPDLDRRRERPGDAADREIRRRVVSDRHQSAISDGHAGPVQGGGAAKLRGMTEKAGRDPNAVALAYRVSSNPEAQPKGTVDGQRKLFTGGAADFVGDIKALQDVGVTSFDFGLFGPTLGATIDNMRRFRDDVVAKVR